MSEINPRQGRRFILTNSNLGSWQRDLSELDHMLRHSNTLQTRAARFFMFVKLNDTRHWQGDFLLGRQVFGAPISHIEYRWIDLYRAPKHIFSSPVAFFDTKDLQNWVNQQIMSCANEQGEWLISYQECYDDTNADTKVLFQLEFFENLSL